MNIYQRINKVMQEVQYVQKDKAVSGGGANYKAVTHDQVVSVARASLVANGVMIFPNQISGEFIIKRDMNATPQPVKMGLYEGVYEINFVNIEDGNDKVTVTVHAHANDNGDKAPGKALTYATKSAILKVLCLETGENDESRVEQRDTNFIGEDKQGILSNLLCDESGLNAKGQKIVRAYKLQSFADVKESKYQEILKAAQ